MPPSHAVSAPIASIACATEAASSAEATTAKRPGSPHAKRAFSQGQGPPESRTTKPWCGGDGGGGDGDGGDGGSGGAGGGDGGSGEDGGRGGEEGSPAGGDGLSSQPSPQVQGGGGEGQSYSPNLPPCMKFKESPRAVVSESQTSTSARIVVCDFCAAL